MGHVDEHTDAAPLYVAAPHLQHRVHLQALPVIGWAARLLSLVVEPRSRQHQVDLGLELAPPLVRLTGTLTPKSVNSWVGRAELVFAPLLERRMKTMPFRAT